MRNLDQLCKLIASLCQFVSWNRSKLEHNRPQHLPRQAWNSMNLQTWQEHTCGQDGCAGARRESACRSRGRAAGLNAMNQTFTGLTKARISVCCSRFHFLPLQAPNSSQRSRTLSTKSWKLSGIQIQGASGVYDRPVCSYMGGADLPIFSQISRPRSCLCVRRSCRRA